MKFTGFDIKFYRHAARLCNVYVGVCYMKKKKKQARCVCVLCFNQALADSLDWLPLALHVINY